MMFKPRLDKIRKALGEKNLDAILVSSPENRRYLSGFTGSDGYLFISDLDAVIATDFRYVEQAGRQAPDFRVERIRTGLGWFLKLAAETKAKKIGIEGQHMTVGTHAAFNKAIATSDWSDKPELVVTTNLIDGIRAIKYAEELDLLTRAIEITDEALVEVSAAMKPGMTEGEVAWELEKAMRERGAEGLAFDTVVGAGPNGAMAHHRADHTVIQEGAPVVIDVGARYEGYCADLTRTIVVGEPDDTFRKVYGIVLEAQLTAEEMVESGMTGGEGDAISRDVIAEAGYGDNFGHSLGHGVGLAVHEYPRLGLNSSDILENGMLFTIEPGIYIPDWGGVRIEDVVVLENGRSRVLSKAPKLKFAG